MLQVIKEQFYRAITDVLPGAGNSFLGGLAAGLMLTRDVIEGE